jgi:nucleoid DNA-binding protein
VQIVLLRVSLALVNVQPDPAEETWMTRSQFVNRIARSAGISRAEAQRVVAVIFDVAECEGQPICDGGSLFVRGLGTITRERPRRRNGKSSADDEDDIVTPEEAAIRRRLAEGIRKLHGIEIENLFPSGWADEKIRP